MKKQNITKEQIIRAAAKVFAEIGFENGSVDDIAKEACIAKGSIYTYFKSKNEILTETVKFLAKERINVLKSLITTKKTARQKLETLLSANKKMATTQPEIFLMNYALLLSTHETIKKQITAEFFKAYLDMIEGIFKEGIKNGEFKKNNPKFLALSLIITNDLIYIFDYLDPSLTNFDKTKSNLLDLFKK